MLAGLSPNEWLLVDASSPTHRGIALKKRQDITWQQMGRGDAAIGDESNDEGEVTQEEFEHNKTKYGPKARGAAYFRNWWSQVLCDGTP